jgi:hypothetical protein
VAMKIVKMRIMVRGRPSRRLAEERREEPFAQVRRVSPQRCNLSIIVDSKS